MPRFTFKDDELEDYIADVLRSKGVRFRRPRKEPLAGSTARRPSIVTDDTIIEPTSDPLTEKIIYRELGQALNYARIWGKSRIQVIGQSPEDPEQFRDAQNLKKDLEQPPRGSFRGRIEIIFIDIDPDWRPRPVIQRKVGIIELTLLIIVALVLITAGLNFVRQRSYSYPPPQPLPRIKCEPLLPNC